MSARLKISTAFYFINFSLSLTNCAKILAVFPTPSISHQIVFRPLIHELVRRGHEVTVITTDPAFPKDEAPINLTEIDVHDLSYKIWINALEESKAGSEDDSISTQIEVVLKTMSQVFKAQVATHEIQEIISRKKEYFDLLIIEAYVKLALAFTHIFKAPTIQISSFGGLQFNYAVVGAPVHPLLYPTVMNQKTYNLSNYEKLEQLYKLGVLERSMGLLEQEDDKLLKNIFGWDIPSIRDLSNNVDMLFLNTHSIWSDNQPVPPSIVYIGGIHNRAPKQLPKDLDYLLNASKNGVIYFSLGTNVKASILPPKQLQMMIKVFAELPYDVIWKWDLESMPGKTENIKIFKWLPQADLLRHPKIKLFITQGGLQSTDESIDAGVPLIGIPLFADQWFNTEKYPYHKIGMKLEMPSLTEEVFREAIKKVISNKSYRENIRRLRILMRDEPQTPLERAVWWTEYVLRHGPPIEKLCWGLQESPYYCYYNYIVGEPNLGDVLAVDVYAKCAPIQKLRDVHQRSVIKISLASTVKENIVKKPACLRVLHNVLKGVRSQPIRWASVVDYGLLIVEKEPCSVMGRCEDDDEI
ncbi:jg19997 [Pararge aegeria aegeria]|uniref:Jg19997 protein n=1 Tax=Pararge aegeria aegeria TaxID=348720 RepID=A0A8S4R3W2_9NEOP|nr:jg19997 [Pararge aegeria aegeria]